MININKSLLSLIWIETNLSLLESNHHPQSKFAFVGDRKNYMEEFYKCQHKLRMQALEPYGGQDITLPWPDTKRQHFWKFYCAGESNSNVKGSTGWDKLIPFRQTLPIEITITDVLSSVAKSDFELFYFPHGTAFVVTIGLDYPESVALDDLVQQAFSIRYKPLFNIKPGTTLPISSRREYRQETSQNKITLNQLARVALIIAKESSVGLNMSEGQPIDSNPFTIFTVLHGREVNPQSKYSFAQILSEFVKGTSLEGIMSPKNNSNIQKALHILTRWDVGSENARLPEFDDKVKIGLKELEGPDNILYLQRRGRVVWYPYRFLQDEPIQHTKLKCYHRNLMFASLQTESLCGFARLMSKELERGIDIGANLRQVTRSAGNMLGLLYSGHRDTYRSQSLYRQIQDNGWEEDVNAIRKHYNNTLLHVKDVT